MTTFDMYLGGPTIKVWDCYQRKLLTQLSNHTKTVTSVCLSHDNTKIISAGLGLVLDHFANLKFSMTHTVWVVRDMHRNLENVKRQESKCIWCIGLFDGFNIWIRFTNIINEFITKRFNNGTGNGWRIHFSCSKINENNYVSTSVVSI